MTIYDRDESITDEDEQQARDAVPAEFPEVDGQDLADEMVRTLVSVIPATPLQAIANARHLTDHNVFVGVGQCLATVRGREFVVPALWPDAETAWENSAPTHPSHPEMVPRGAVVYWSNGRHGHVALSVGGGLCRTTDYRRNGFVDLAPIANLASWCGGRLNGWGETLNSYDVWPDPDPAPEPVAKPAWGLTEKERLLQNALKRAKTNHANRRRIDGLEKWLAHVETRLKEEKKKKHHR